MIVVVILLWCSKGLKWTFLPLFTIPTIQILDSRSNLLIAILNCGCTSETPSLVVSCSGWKAGLLPAVGGGAYRGLWCTAGEEQFQEADESLCAFLNQHWSKHDFSPLPGGVRVDESGTLHFFPFKLGLSDNNKIQCIFDVYCVCVP